MFGDDEGLEKGQEEGDQQIADVKAVDIGVGSDDDFAIAEVIQAGLDADRLHDIVEFFIFVNGFLLFAIAVEGFSAQREHGLEFGIAGTDHVGRRGIALGQKQGRQRAFVLVFGLAPARRVAEMELAVAQLRNPVIRFLGLFPGFLLDRLDLLAHGFILADFVEQLGFDRRVFEQHFHDGLADFVDQVGSDFRIAELVFRLGFEDRVVEADGDGADDAVSDVVGIQVFLGDFVDGLEDAFLEGRQVGAAVVGVLAVDEGIIAFIEAVGVGEGEFQLGGTVVERFIQRL